MRTLPRAARLLAAALALLLLAPPLAAQTPLRTPAATDTLVLRAPALDPDTTLPLLTRQEAIARVLGENRALAIARLERAIAENDVTLGHAGFLPRVSLSAAQRRAPGRADADGRPTPGTQTLDVTAGAALTLFEGGARVTRLERFAALARLRALDEEALTEQLLADALVAYYDVGQQQARLGVLAEAVALSEERLRIAEQRRDVGAASELEVNRARVDLNADRAALLRQEAALAAAKARLARLLHLPETTAFRVEEADAPDPTLAREALEAALLAEAPTLRAARLAEEVAALDERAVRAEFLPRVDLTLGYAFAELTDPLLRAGQAAGFTYGLTATIDVFDGFNRRRRLENAALRRAQQAAAREQSETALRTALEATYELYLRSLELVALEEENVEAARRNAAVALERFRLGAASSLELREVQRALIDAESRLVAARFEAKGTETDLRALAGQLRAALGVAD